MLQKVWGKLRLMLIAVLFVLLHQFAMVMVVLL
jgi:hypothetical protein